MSEDDQIAYLQDLIRRSSTNPVNLYLSKYFLQNLQLGEVKTGAIRGEWTRARVLLGERTPQAAPMSKQLSGAKLLTEELLAFVESGRDPDSRLDLIQRANDLLRDHPDCIECLRVAQYAYTETRNEVGLQKCCEARRGLEPDELDPLWCLNYVYRQSPKKIKEITEARWALGEKQSYTLCVTYAEACAALGLTELAADYKKEAQSLREASSASSAFREAADHEATRLGILSLMQEGFALMRNGKHQGALDYYQQALILAGDASPEYRETLIRHCRINLHMAISRAKAAGVETSSYEDGR